jgi:1,4-dihydroxy-6-naphthoate synthase
MHFTLGFSPCPNDTFIFDALVNGKIDTKGHTFDVVLEDVQTLNEWAMEGRLDISKISYGALPALLDQYHLLNAGGALGKGVGPLLIARKENNLSLDRIPETTIAIPGKNTTAHLLFSLAFPTAKNKQFMVFSSIEEAVLTGAADAGVIIHENRFTYQQKGLVKLMDLGEFWETKTSCPIPLGGIIIKQSFDQAIRTEIDQLIRASLQYAFDRYPSLPDYVVQHAQEMDEQVMRQHIDLYVNNFSLDLGEAGRAAIESLLKMGKC